MPLGQEHLFPQLQGVLEAASSQPLQELQVVRATLLEGVAG